jgi:hypothetical protein
VTAADRLYGEFYDFYSVSPENVGYHHVYVESGVAQWLRHCATSRTVSGSILGGVTLGIFSVATDGTMCSGVDSASKNEYQGFLLGMKAAGA